MANKEEIISAIGAHGVWKSRLKNAVDSGTLNVTVETIRDDHQCAFGKWLYSHAPRDQASANFTEVKALHARFHNVAATVAELALAGSKSEAKAILEGEYSEVSSDLTLAMIAWKRSLG